MKKLFTILTAGVFAVAVNAQEEITLSQTNDLEVPESGGILSCQDDDNGWGRVFVLSDYGISNFTPTAVDAAAIVWDGGYAESFIYTMDGLEEFPDSFAHSAIQDSGFSGFFGNNTGDRIWGWVSFEIFDEVDEALTDQFYLTVVGPVSNGDDGWAGSFVPLPTDAGYIRSAYFGDPNVGCYAVDVEVITRLDQTSFADPHGAYLITVTGYAEGQGLVKLDSNQLAVYPNPATDVVNIQMKDNASIDSVSIVNMAGQSVFNSVVKGNSINVSSLAPGVYVVRVKDTNNVTHMTKLIKK